MVLPFKAYIPRPEHCLIFYLRDLQNVGYEKGNTRKHPRCTLNGQHTLTSQRYTAYDFRALQIVFQPGALFRLTGIPMHELTNTFIDAEAIWGKEIRETQEAMCNAEGTAAAIVVAEIFLNRIIRGCKRDLSPVDKVSQFILSHPGPLSMDYLADQSYLSTRQFSRRFNDRIGVNPKTYERIARFGKTFGLKNNFPESDWLTIALACGYYDYNHLVKDYKDFTSLTPAAFYEKDTKAPERVFGVIESLRI